MNNDSNMEQIPKAIAPPAILDLESGQLNVWTDKTTMRSNAVTIQGEGRVYFDLLPFPDFRFEFTSDENPLKQKFLFSTISDWEMECGLPIGAIKCGNTGFDKLCSGSIYEQVLIRENEALYTKVSFLVLNGPVISGDFIQRAGEPCYERISAKVGDCQVTIEPHSKAPQDRRSIYKSTHLIRCEFTDPKSISFIDSFKDNLFWTLSLIKCRWVGLVGPWLESYDDKAITLRLSSTKTMRNGGAISWYHDSIPNCFPYLAPLMFDAFSDLKRGNALQTALHWLIESEQCAGGVEGAMVLQQSALECLSWLTIVGDKGICSGSGFAKLPAADKIRWLLSSYRIDFDIPKKCTSIQDYAKAYGFSDLIDSFVDVRNALVHAEPKKVAKLFDRKQGNDERSELWFQIGGLLHQAFLASVGYRGPLRRRDTDEHYAANAVMPAPWATSSYADCSTENENG
jgi:hypothetical protein